MRKHLMPFSRLLSALTFRKVLPITFPCDFTENLGCHLKNFQNAANSKIFKLPMVTFLGYKLLRRIANIGSAYSAISFKFSVRSALKNGPEMVAVY